MNEIFQAMPRQRRAEFRGEYLSLLKTRDGMPDASGERFTVRERFFADMEAHPIRRVGPPAVRPEVFARNEGKHDPDPGLDECTLWALAVAKSNRSERYGVEYTLETKPERRHDLEDPHTFILIEENYHTRILRDVVETIGLEMGAHRPHRATQLMIRIMSRAPQWLSSILVFDGELAGVALFRLLMEKGRELFSDQPASWSRMEGLFQQILTDEVGHVRFVHSNLGPVRLRLARWLLPIVVRTLMQDVREVEMLFGRERLMAEIMKADLSLGTASATGPAQPLQAVH